MDDRHDYQYSPVFSLICSLILPTYLRFIGRTKVLILGVSLIGINNAMLALLPYSPSASLAITLSFGSRMLAGIGSALAMITSYAILTSDYPEDIPKIIAMMEIASGIGRIIGPMVGSLVFSIGGFFYSCFGIGMAILLYVPILYYIVGPSRPYLLSTDTINLIEISKKPVKIT